MPWCSMLLCRKRRHASNKVTCVLANMYRKFDGAFSLSFPVQCYCADACVKYDEVADRALLVPNCMPEIFGGHCQ